MKTFSISGNNLFKNCEINSDENPVGFMSTYLEVAEGTPAIMAAIYDPLTGAKPDSTKVQMSITGPDGTQYNQNLNTNDHFVEIANGSVAALCILSPDAGTWTLSVKCTVSTSFRANIFTLPSADPMDNTLQPMEKYYPGNATPAYQYRYDLFRWGYLAASAILAEMRGTQGLVMDLKALIIQAFAVSADSANVIMQLIAGQSADGVNTTLAQQTKVVTPDTLKNILVNGDASQKLTGWTIIENGGDGWRVQVGFAQSIEYKNNFAVSDGWCKKSQLIDLVNGGGFSPQYLDQSPVITVIDRAAAAYPSEQSTPSQYYLLVELRDANQNVIKRYQTGAISFPAQGSGLNWLRFIVNFSDYGSGARYVYFEHGGLDAEKYEPQYGMKITGGVVGISMAVPTIKLKELIVNGSAENGLNGWDIIGTNVWSTENGPGVDCPGSPGKSVFSVTSGTGKKSQRIDLIAAGYSAESLDKGPLVQMSQWLCAQPGSQCNYRVVVELRDAQQNVITRFDSDSIDFPPTLAAATVFIKFSQSWINYGSGLRYIYFEHSATTTAGQATSKLTGSSLQIVCQENNAQFLAEEMAEAAAAPPTPIANTTIEPYKWVCYLEMTYFNANYVGSGWLIPQPKAGNFVVMTAAHCIRSRPVGWPRSITIIPAQGNQGGSPYQPVDIPRGRMQIPINWLIKNQASPSSELYDYGLLYVTTPANWDPGGFTPIKEDDAVMKGQSATITGFPANPPYTQGLMYTEDIKISPWNSTQVSVPTNFKGGSSGGPIYVKGTSNCVSIQSYGTKFFGYTITANGTTRINDKVLADITRWKTPLTANDRITKLQMVIRTGSDLGAGTDDDITCSIDGKSYDLESLWIGGAGGLRSRNEAGDFDGYDLTPQLNSYYPQGITIQYLLGKTYSIKRVIPILMYHSLLNGNWQVESVAIFVNDQLLCAKNFYTWINFTLDHGSDTISGPFTLG